MRNEKKIKAKIYKSLAFYESNIYTMGQVNQWHFIQ